MIGCRYPGAGRVRDVALPAQQQGVDRGVGHGGLQLADPVAAHARQVERAHRARHGGNATQRGGGGGAPMSGGTRRCERDEPVGRIEHDGFAGFEAGVAVVDGLAQLDGHDSAVDVDAVDVELISAQRVDRLGEELHVRVAPGVRVAVRTHALDVGRERFGDGGPVVRTETVEIALDRVAPERAGEDRTFVVVERNLRDRGEAGGAHLVRGADHDAGQRLGVEAGGDVGELRLEEHQAERVFERLHLGVGRELFLADDRLHALDGRVVVAGVGEDGAEIARVLLLERLAPAQVAGAPGRRRRAAPSTAGSGDRAPRAATARSRRAGVARPTRLPARRGGSPSGRCAFAP